MNRNPTIIKLLRKVRGESGQKMRARIALSIKGDAKRGIGNNPLVQAANRYVH